MEKSLFHGRPSVVQNNLSLQYGFQKIIKILRLNQILTVSNFEIWLEQNDIAFYLQNEFTKEEQPFCRSGSEL